MAPHSSTFAWKISWMEEPGRLQSMGSLESDTPSGHPHLQTGANWGEGAGEREGAVGGKGSPITAPTLRTPVRGCGCHLQAGGGGPSRAHAWETSGGGARAPAQRGQRGPVCVCARVGGQGGLCRELGGCSPPAAA